MKAVSKSSKRIVTFEKEAGGAIRHAKRKEPVTSEKILQAVDFNTRGGGEFAKPEKKNRNGTRRSNKPWRPIRVGGLDFTTSNISICTRTFPEEVEDSTPQCAGKWCTG